MAAHKTPHTARQSLSGKIDPASENLSNDKASEAPRYADHEDPRSSLSGQRIFPVIYTEYHFEDLVCGALQYTIDMLERHEEMGIIICRRNGGDKSHEITTSLILGGKYFRDR